MISLMIGPNNPKNLHVAYMNTETVKQYVPEVKHRPIISQWQINIQISKCSFFTVSNEVLHLENSYFLIIFIKVNRKKIILKLSKKRPS
jgi:hypothetical protein